MGYGYDTHGRLESVTEPGIGTNGFAAVFGYVPDSDLPFTTTSKAGDVNGTPLLTGTRGIRVREPLPNHAEMEVVGRPSLRRTSGSPVEVISADPVRRIQPVVVASTLPRSDRWNAIPPYATANSGAFGSGDIS